jgi:methionine-rich copper-binding protein CopC
MLATALAVSTSASSLFSKRFHRVLVLSALFVTASLSALAQNISVSPANRAFPKTVVGTTSASQAVKISNPGKTAQSIDIVMSGDFTETDNCGGSVAADSYCTAEISFAPTLVGTIQGAASVYNNSNNLLTLVGLTGVGVAPVTTQPTSLKFSAGTIGTLSAPQTFNITNGTSSAVNVTGITASSDYLINTGTCLTTPLAPGGSCTVSVQVQPTSATDDGAVTITDNAPDGLPLQVSLKSTATGSQTTPLSLSAHSLTFKTVTGGTSAPQTITVTNKSSSAVTLGPISASNDYAIVSNACPPSLASKGTCTFGITFNPTFVGSINGSVAVAYTGSNSPQLVNLTGTSEAPLTVAPIKLTFAAQAVGTVSAAQAVTITNNNTTPVTLSNVVPSGDFRVQASGSNCSVKRAMGAGDSCTVEIQFAPSVARRVEGALTVTDNASPDPLPVPLTGEGISAAGFTLSATPSTLSIVRGSSGTSTIAVTDVGGFKGSVTLAASGLPTGVTATFGTNPTTGSSVLTLAASATATTGAATVTITGTSGSLTATTSISLTVNVPPSFTLSATPNTLSVVQGSSGTSTIAVTDIGGFTGSVTLAASGLPTGVTATFGTNPTTGSSVLTLAASATATTGAATVTITGTSGSLTSTTTIGLTVKVPPSFTLSATPNTLSVVQGSSGTSTIAVTDIGGFTGSVTLAASGLPTGVTATFGTNPTTGSSVLTLAASATATTGAATVTITGTSGSLTATTSISLTVNPPASFTLSATPNTLSVVQGSSGTSTIAVTDIGGFTGSVTLAASGLPTGVTATFGTNPTTGSSVLTLAASATATTGAATVTITGTSGSLTATTSISLTVNVPPSFTLSATPNTLSVVQGSSGTSTIAVTDIGGFTGSVTLAASGLPTGVTATFGTNPTTGSSVLTLVASATATTGGPVTVTITGTSGSLTATTSIKLTVNPAPSFTLSATPNTLSVVQGSSGTSTIAVTDIGGFTGSVTLAASGLPTGVTATFGTNPTTGSSVLTLAASATATTGAATVTITGTSGSLTATTSISLTVNPPASFTLSATPNTLSVVQGSSGTSTITVTDVSGFTGSVNLSVTSTLPNGVTPTFGTNPTTGSSVLTLAASATATTGTVTVTITGTSGSLTATTNISLTVTPTPNFTLSASPSTLSVAQGGNGTSTITVNPTNSFTGSVTLAASGLPTGVTATFGTNPTTGNSVLTLAASATATTGTATVTITGTSGSLPAQTTTIGLTVTTGATAVLNPASAQQGSSGTILITGTNTSFGPTTTINFGNDITLGTLTVNGPTSASVPIAIDDVAVTGSRSVTITTGAQVVTATFTVIAGTPAVTVISPNVIGLTQTESVSVTGAFTNWVNGTTQANFGPGVAVGGGSVGGFGPVTVTGPTTLTASLVTSGAAPGFNAVQIKTNSQTLTVNNGMDVETCTTTPPTILLISPLDGASNVPLNTEVQAQFSAPMNRSTFSLGNNGTTTVYFWNASIGGEIPGTITLDATGTIATITPSQSLAAGQTFYTYWSYASSIQDACGNNFGAAEYYFTTAFSTDTTGPTLTGTSPVSDSTNVPLNGNATGGTPVVLQFNVPIDPITAQAGFSMETGGNPVPGNFTYSSNNETVTFTPVSPLTASTTYTVTYTTQITDTTGTPLTNPNSFSFVTGTAADTTYPYVTFADPPDQTFGVGLNVTPHFTFNEPVNALTIPAALTLEYVDDAGPNIIVPATVTVSPNGLIATLTPTAPLLPSTYYNLYFCGYTDIAGNSGNCYNSYFFTGTTAVTTPTTVTAINPSNNQTGVPINAEVTAVMSNNIDPTTVTTSSITVMQGSTPIAGTVTLASNGLSLTFVPNSPLTVSTPYNVSVGGFNDIDGNAVTPFTSKFTTGTTGYASGSFTVVSTSPSIGATNVSVNSPVAFTMSNLINAASVNTYSVEVCIGNCAGEYVAGSFSVSGNTVTFTPLTPYPANQVMGMEVYGLTDEAGNAVYNQIGTFTTANTVSTTPPTVTISPANGATNIGLNTQIVLTFSESINPSTITSNTLALFNGDTSINYNYSISLDNRTIVVNYNGSTLPSGATITVELTSGIQDLSGNPLANTSSQFTLTTVLNGYAPSVIEMRPGNGATNVPANTVVTLFTNTAMNPSTISGALYVTDNGVVVSGGGVQLFSNGQAIEFTPPAPFGAGDVIQVTLTSAALSASGVGLSGFSGQFTVAGSPANTSATVEAVNPFYAATGVPLNTTTLQVQYDQPLLASTVNTTNVTLYQYSTGSYPTITPTLVDGGEVINIALAGNLVSGSQYQLCVYNVTNTDGLAAQNYCNYFTAGTATDTVAPAIVSEAPINDSTNIGTNTLVSVNFNKAVNPISVTGSTIDLSAGSTNEVPSSISFSPDYTRVTITPQAPLPPSTQMKVAINGVTSEAGVAAAVTSSKFTTATAPDFVAPYVVSSSVQSQQTNVPVNSVFSMTFSASMDIGSYNAADVNIYGGPYPNGVPATVTWNATQTSVFIAPSSPLYVGTQYCLESYYMTDLAGNAEQNFDICFTTSFSPNTTPPTVVDTNPESGEALVPVNAPVEILFSEPVQPTSIGQITLTTGGNPVAFTPSFSDANQLLTLTPTLPLLAANASYTITITGVQDTAGNLMTGTVANTFQTGPTFNLLAPYVAVVDPPANSTGVGTNVTPQIVFSERLNPLSVVSSSNELYNNGSVELINNATGQYVPATVSMTTTRLEAIITPNSVLEPGTMYEIYVGCSEYYYDVAGNSGNCTGYYFTTATGADTTHATVSTISPANVQTAVPVNAQIIAVLSDEIDPATITSSSITVMPQGGSAIAGTVTLATNALSLTFVPNSPLTVSTVYNVAVGGFNDVQGNLVTAFTSMFTTGTSGYATGSFAFVSSTPASGATGVSVTSPVTVTMSNLIDPASVNASTFQVYVSSTGDIVTGSYSVSGASMKFTPLTQYPGGTQMEVYVCNVLDEAGNSTCIYAASFTTTNTADKTPPTVTITPVNGTTNVGLNTSVVLTFSKSINPATINTSSVNLLNGDVALNSGISISSDNRTVILNYQGAALPAGATITVTANSSITDLSGNALANTTAQFTTTPAVLTAAPSVISMRPGNGATGVPINTVITLFTSAPMNTSTIAGALYVSQNGTVVSGTTNLGSNGQSIEFTPSALLAGTPTQVFLNSTAQDTYGNSLSYFSGSFTTAGALANTPAAVEVVNPFYGATGVPLNTILQVQYDQPLLASTVNSTNVTLYQYSTGTYVTLTPTLVGGGQVINIVPASNLLSGSEYQLCVYNVTNTDSVAAQNYCDYFTAGTAADTVAPTVLYVAPPNLAVNIGTNAGVSVRFSKAMNPISVSGSSIQLSGGSVTEAPSSISFTTDYTGVMIIPQAPLPSSTQMSIAISGVTSEAGVAAASQTTSFNTMAGPDFSAPYVVNPSVQNSQTVGTNASFAMQFNEPMDPGSVNPGGAQDVYLYDNDAGTYVNAPISFSTDLTTVFLTPTAKLTASHYFQLCSYYMTDLSGNAQQNYCVNFYTGTGTDTTAPVVRQVSPPSGLTNVPINAPVDILFKEPISGASLDGVTLTQSGTVVPTTTTLFDGDQGIRLLPLLPLTPGMVYTINVTGVVDINGNAQASFASTSFTTGTGTDLTAPTIVSTNPANGASGVATSTTVQVVFSEAMDEASFDPNTNFTLQGPNGSTTVTATVTFSANLETVTLHPSAALAAGTYYMYVGWPYTNYYIYDLGGNILYGTYFTFTVE